MGSNEAVVGNKGQVNTKNRQMVSIGAIFTSKYISHKVAKSMVKFIKSQSCDEFQLPACLSLGDGAIYRTSKQS